MKKLVIIFTLVFILVAQPVFAKVAPSTEKILGTTVNVVRVDIEDDIRFAVAQGNDKLIGSQPFMGIVNNYAPVAAINGNFFDAYKTLVPMANIIRNGEVMQLVGDTPSLLVFGKNEAFIRQLSLKYFGSLDGKTENKWNNETQKMEFNTFNVWYENVEPNDTSGVYKFTSIRNKALSLKSGTVIEVVKDEVAKIYKPSGEVSIPKDGYIIYFGKDAATEEYISQRFRTGRKVKLQLVDKADKNGFKVGEKEYLYDNITQLIAAGPMLLQNGEKVVAESVKKYKENKISKNSAQRSAIGLTDDGKLIMITAVANMNKLADIMKALGAKDAMNLDGGASSALYANGKILKSPGRNLNTVFLILKDKK